MSEYELLGSTESHLSTIQQVSLDICIPAWENRSTVMDWKVQAANNELVWIEKQTQSRAI